MADPTLADTIAGIQAQLNSQATSGTSLSVVGTRSPSLASAVATVIPAASALIPTASSSDPRVRLSAPHYASAQTQIYGPPGANNILNPLYGTNGLMFPYTPSVQFSQDVEYQAFSMVHTNTDYLAYQRTPSVNLTITGKFAIQSQTEGAYALAAIHFLRVVSKMYFGTQAKENAGLPPPILWLNGFGGYMFNNLRVIVKSHSWSYDENMDLIHVKVAGGDAYLPALFTLTVAVVVQQTPAAMRDQFNLDDFRTGKLMRSPNNAGWI